MVGGGGGLAEPLDGQRSTRGDAHRRVQIRTVPSSDPEIRIRPSRGTLDRPYRVGVPLQLQELLPIGHPPYPHPSVGGPEASQRPAGPEARATMLAPGAAAQEAIRRPSFTAYIVIHVPVHPSAIHPVTASHSPPSDSATAWRAPPIAMASQRPFGERASAFSLLRAGCHQRDYPVATSTRSSPTIVPTRRARPSGLQATV